MKRKIEKSDAIVAYKSFDENFCCDGFQFKEGKSYHFNGDSGFYACQKPLEVFKGAFPSRIARVKLWGDVEYVKEVNIFASDIKIDEEVVMDEFIAGINGDEAIILKGESFYSDCDKECIVRNIISKYGFNSIYSRKDASKIFSIGENDMIVSDNTSMIYSGGDYATINSSGFYTRILSIGGNTTINSTGGSCSIESYGRNAIVVAIGADNMVKSMTGSWVTLAEWDGENRLKSMKTEYVDGERIKEGIWYRLIDGDFVETKS